MKFIIAFCLLVVLMVLEPIYSAKICVIRVNTCNSNVTVCGRYGRSNLCKRFRNQCALETANCSDNVGYTAVNATRCRGIALNRRTTCNGLRTTSNGVFSNLFGSTNGNNVQPIVINTGK